MPAHARSVCRVVGTASLAATATATALAGPASAQGEVVLPVGHADAVEVNHEDGELTHNEVAILERYRYERVGQTGRLQVLCG